MSSHWVPTTSQQLALIYTIGKYTLKGDDSPFTTYYYVSKDPLWDPLKDPLKDPLQDPFEDPKLEGDLKGNHPVTVALPMVARC